ncbi:MAG TPA: YiiX/YebB-like N1pC/P60 family cysteine hydrolase [Pseudolabrys sp.]|nr:YiiX/YebB-like N1pC/P60 family cysteine hydrolase [Pseudolabrys sp.]
MTWVLDRVGRHIAAYLQRPAPGYEPFTPADPTALQALIKPGDILLIEGRTHIAGVIKYLTQSTWSHAALYVGPVDGQVTSKGEPCDLVESNLEAGIVSVPLSTYFDYHTRICRPVDLLPEDRQTVCDYAIERIGLQYDLKNIVDLGRYLVPLPVPQRFRRRMIALGSGDPTKLICSALIAEAFAAVGYPILPAIEHVESAQARREIYHIRHSSLYAPRDFDISPYFAIIKPTIEMGFDYKKIAWAPRDSTAGLHPPHHHHHPRAS